MVVVIDQRDSDAMPPQQLGEGRYREARVATAGPSIDRFFSTGVLELQDKLGPVLWQFAPRMAFDEAGFAAFLELLPQQLDGRAIAMSSRCAT